MNILDENVPLDQRELLRGAGIHCRMIGQDVARASTADDNILALLHHLKKPTLFSRDADFFKQRLCHPSYCLVFLAVAPEESALFVRRVLRHPRFATRAQRLGLVVRAHHDGLEYWQRNRSGLQRERWSRGL